MGAWSGGLYGSDFAMDLRSLVGGVMRAPLSDDEALAEIWTSHGVRAGGVDALDYWLVLADQLERRGMRNAGVFDRARAIIESGEDVLELQALGASAGTVAKRRQETADLLARLRDPRPEKPRRPLRKPQPLFFEVGEALTWPTDRGDCINPYVAPEKLHLLGGFNQDGWGFGVVSDAGHQFGVLAYHAVRALMWRRPERPTPELAAHCRRSGDHYGTLTEQRMRRLGIERIGRVSDEALGAPPDPFVRERQARRVTLENIGLDEPFGLDAFNSIGPGTKFPFAPPSRQPLDPDEPDQRPGFGWHGPGT